MNGKFEIFFVSSLTTRVGGSRSLNVDYVHSIALILLLRFLLHLLFTFWNAFTKLKTNICQWCSYKQCGSTNWIIMYFVEYSSVLNSIHIHTHTHSLGNITILLDWLPHYTLYLRYGCYSGFSVVGWIHYCILYRNLLFLLIRSLSFSLEIYIYFHPPSPRFLRIIWLIGVTNRKYLRIKSKKYSVCNLHTHTYIHTK